MPLVTMRQLLDEAAAGGYGVAAFDANNMEQIQSIMQAAQETRSPVIVQASRGARSYAPGNWDPRGPGKAARAAQRQLCAQRMNELGMAGHAGDYEALSLEEMAERYRSGVGTPA